MKIGIPVLNRGDLLLRLIRSIDIEAEVMIVVNRIGPLDTSVGDAVTQLATNGPANLKLLTHHVNGNLGVSGSWNLILDHFGGDCIISNSDLEFLPGVLEEAVPRVYAREKYVMQFLRAASCFYVTSDFRATLGWFDENFYPAYHEDQEMSVRSRRLNAWRCNCDRAITSRVVHEGSQTLKSADTKVRRYIQAANKLHGEYLRMRWGDVRMVKAGVPSREYPFDNPQFHPADWTLDIEMRATIARKCEELTGFDCPIVFHRQTGGLMESFHEGTG